MKSLLTVLKEQGVMGFLKALLMGQEDSDTGLKTNPQKLQEAVQAEINLANAKADSASVAVTAAGKLRSELAALAAQHKELGNQALSAEKSGDSAKAQRILALQLALQEKISAASMQYEQAEAAAQQLIKDARAQKKKAGEAERDMPRRVLQLEMNSMIEKARQMEAGAADQLKGKTSYKALAESVDLNTARLTVRSLIDDSSNMDEEISGVLKEAEFQKAYDKLRQLAQSPSSDGAIDAEFTEVESPADKAQRLLSAPAFGGLLDRGFEPSREKEKVVRVEGEEVKQIEKK